MSLIQKRFDGIYEHVKDNILSKKVDKKKEKKIISFISVNMKKDPVELLALFMKKMISIDKKLDISIELAEMYSFAITFCIAKKLNMDDKEINALYDDVNKETKNILEGAMKANQEMRYLAEMFSLKCKKEGGG